MIELNLLPDIKLQYIKAQHHRRLVLTVAVLVTAVSVGLVVLMFSYNLLQKKNISDLNNDINRQSSQLKNKPQISKILTVQNQLEELTQLHNGKPAAARVFSYLNQVTPATVGISNFQIDFTAKTAVITGNADALNSVNKYVDTLKYTTYSNGDKDADSTKAFSNVVLSSFGLTSDNKRAASYSITVSYDPVIFDNTQDAKFNVPNLITTRSALDKPGDLFQTAPQTPAQGAQ